MKSIAKRLKIFLKNEEIEDIILFGSIAKGKISPNDIDIAVLMGKKDETIKEKIRKAIPKADIQLITIKEVNKRIFLTLIKEGYSVKNERYLHEIYGLSPVKLYKYNLKELTLSKKVMFERAIKTIKGITKLSNSVVLVPIEHTGEFEEFLKSWNLDMDTKEYELMPLMRKEEF